MGSLVPPGLSRRMGDVHFFPIFAARRGSPLWHTMECRGTAMGLHGTAMAQGSAKKTSRRCALLRRTRRLAGRDNIAATRGAGAPRHGVKNSV